MNPETEQSSDEGALVATIPAITLGAEKEVTAAESVAQVRDALARFPDVISELATAFGVSVERFAQKESIRSLEDAIEIPFDSLLTWDKHRIRHWFAVLGNDLMLSLSLVGLPDSVESMTLDLHEDMDHTTAFSAFVATADSVISDQGNDVYVAVRIRITKLHAIELVSKLLSSRRGYLSSAELLANTVVLVFYCASAWSRLVSPRALWTWESEGVIREGHRTFIALCDAEGYCAGKAIEILGLRLKEDINWLQIARTSLLRFTDRTAHVRRLRQKESYWDTAPKVLTPYHLAVQERNHGSHSVMAQITEMRATLSAAFLASTVFGDSEIGLTLRFAGPRPCNISVPLRPSIAVSPPSTLAAVIALAHWAYRRGSVDRLLIARECLSEMLPQGVEATLQTLDKAAGEALDAAKANFILYIRHNTKVYFTQRQQAMDATYIHAEEVRKSISSLVSDLVGNVYATGALLVGAAVAQLVSPVMLRPIQWLAFAAYILYVIFILAFVMPLRRHQVDRETASLDERIKSMAELSDAQRESIKRIAEPDVQDFRTYFWKTAFVYIAMMVLVTLYFLIVMNPV